MATSIDIVPATVPISVTQGDTLAWTTTILQDSVGVDLTGGDVVSVTIESAVGGENVLVVSSATAAVVLDEDGNAAVTITAAQTGAIAVGGYWYSLRWINSSSAVRTLHAGPFTVLKPIV